MAALTFYHSPQGRIPLFLELRSLNSAGSKEILPFIHSQYRSGSSLPFSSFISALKKGYFILILDGFDEVEPDSRSTVEDQILLIEREFPNCPIVVSGRPDERFASWEHFIVYTVCPMTYYKTRKLIEKADYDMEVKSEFLKRLNKEFFDQHESFLSTPLLAIMLMLTFADFAEIPSSLHVFYRNSFDTLVRRHDALKSQFLRTMHSGCSAEQFRRLFASFCVITYSKSKFQFSHDDALRYVAHALQQQGIKAEPSHVLADLIESICLLQVEGFEISFVHRSFQEYFCALFVSQAPGGAVALYLNSGRYRTYDTVLPMLYAMVPDRVEAEWVLPTIKRLCGFVHDQSSPGQALLQATFASVIVVFISTRDVMFHFEDTDISRNIAVLRRFYPAYFVWASPEAELTDEERLERRREVLTRVLALEGSGDDRFNGLRKTFEETQTLKGGQQVPHMIIPLRTSDDALLELSGILPYYEHVARILSELEREVEARVQQEDRFLRDTFGIDV